ncbi:hypothetical protein [Lysinibacter cavernae]|uniref:Uncharacterized protein n=1 Tax=Lysinibacter cavernae TaxID=1640652 RepID=A0A7X5QZ27_9MICO|nr:hypothetical protein [Lysinibacter cavernae]NIH52621.1 hypothetical protein [Lysinibacter cavernae]
MIIVFLVMAVLIFLVLGMIIRLVMSAVLGNSRSARCRTISLDANGNIVSIKFWSLTESAGEKTRVLNQKAGRTTASVVSMCQHPGSNATCESSMPFVEVGHRIGTCPCKCHNSDGESAEVPLPSTSFQL